MTNTKTLIKNWVFDGTYVWGNKPSESPSSIRTSTVKRIWFNTDNRLICETQNSLYELEVPGRT